jgi:hypothetical protein
MLIYSYVVLICYAILLSAAPHSSLHGSLEKIVKVVECRIGSQGERSDNAYIYGRRPPDGLMCDVYRVRGSSLVAVPFVQDNDDVTKDLFNRIPEIL